MTRCKHLEGLIDIDGNQVKEGDYLAFPNTTLPEQEYQLLWNVEEWGYAIFFVGDGGKPHTAFPAFKPGMCMFMQVVPKKVVAS